MTPKRYFISKISDFLVVCKAQGQKLSLKRFTRLKNKKLSDFNLWPRHLHSSRIRTKIGVFFIEKMPRNCGLSFYPNLILSHWTTISIIKLENLGVCKALNKKKIIFHLMLKAPKIFLTSIFSINKYQIGFLGPGKHQK